MRRPQAGARHVGRTQTDKRVAIIAADRGLAQHILRATA